MFCKMFFEFRFFIVLNRFLIDCKMYTDEYNYIENAVLGGRQYCAKDPLSTLPTARVVNKM